MTDPFVNAKVKALMEAIDRNDDEAARKAAEYLAAEGFAEGDLGQSGPGYALAAAFSKAALFAKFSGRPGEAAHLIERRDRLCKPQEVQDATLVIMFELGVRNGWLPADDYDRVDNYLGDLTGHPAQEKWKTVQRRS
jgi:hypothetical protein